MNLQSVTEIVFIADGGTILFNVLSDILDDVTQCTGRNIQRGCEFIAIQISLFPIQAVNDIKRPDIHHFRNLQRFL